MVLSGLRPSLFKLVWNWTKNFPYGGADLYGFLFSGLKAMVVFVCTYLAIEYPADRMRVL